MPLASTTCMGMSLSGVGTGSTKDITAGVRKLIRWDLPQDLCVHVVEGRGRQLPGIAGPLQEAGSMQGSEIWK